MSPDAALQHAQALEQALAEARDGARALRPLLRRLDAPGLLEWARTRDAQRARLQALERALVEALGPAPSQGPGTPLGEALGRLRALAATVRAEDTLNGQLLGRTLACTRGLSQALGGAGPAYDRRGGRAPAPTGAVATSRRA